MWVLAPPKISEEIHRFVPDVGRGPVSHRFSEVVICYFTSPSTSCCLGSWVTFTWHCFASFASGTMPLRCQQDTSHGMWSCGLWRTWNLQLWCETGGGHPGFPEVSGKQGLKLDVGLGTCWEGGDFPSWIFFDHKTARIRPYMSYE